jgi:hypothetical protein
MREGTKLKRLALFAVLVLAIHSGPAAADIGGYLTVGAEASAPRIKLSSFQWIEANPPKDEAAAYMHVPAPPKSGAGELIVVKPAATSIPDLASACAGKGAIPILRIDVPSWEVHSVKEGEQPYRHYVLKDVKLFHCAHAAGAAGEVLHLKFSAIEATSS